MDAYVLTSPPGRQQPVFFIQSCKRGYVHWRVIDLHVNRVFQLFRPVCLHVNWNTIGLSTCSKQR